MITHRRILSLIFFLIGLSVSATAQNVIDASGRLERLKLGNGWLNAQTNVVVPEKGWKKRLALSEAKALRPSGTLARRIWNTTLRDETKRLEFDIRQIVREARDRVVFDVQAIARDDGETEGVLFWIDIPAEQFAGGTWQIGPHGGNLPLKLTDEIYLAEDRADEISFTGADSTRRPALKIRFNRHARVVIQDGRQWNDCFSALIDIHNGTLPKDHTARLKVSLQLTGSVDETPARLTLDAKTPLYTIIGLGGNYCFNSESPITRFTLDNLNVAFARVEMSLDQWEPQPANRSSAAAHFGELIATDKPGSKLRREFELMRELMAKKIPFIASVWRLPDWAYTRPPADRHATGNRIAEDAWPDVLETIGAYLLYAKEMYQAEPNFFSFNEPDIGINVLFDAQEHCAAIKRLGAHFKKLGLKTRLLLGETARAGGTHTYALPTTKDAEAMKYVGALAFHSWGGAAPEQYGAWAKLAKELKLPLLVSEVGVDPDAWNGARYQNFKYAAREMTHYQEIFLYARPQAMLYWEYTGDYALLRTGAESQKLALTERFCMQKHWTEFIPPGSMALKTSSDQASILFTAFRSKDEPKQFALHLANQAWSRKATIEGVPAEIKTLNAVCTSQGKLFKKLEPLTVIAGKVSVELPGESLLTLTTMTIPELKLP
ncbi:MAG: hypothetical protein V1899_02155 [Planctomycetota bacterium]